MPIPWTLAAKAIPWTEVIAATPGIVKGARELFRRATGKESAPAVAGAVQVDPLERMLRLEARQEELERELQAGSELISRLAEQNERLVIAIDRLKRRLALVAALAALSLVAVLVLGLLR